MSSTPFRIEQQIRPYPDGSSCRYTLVIKRDTLDGDLSIVIKSLGEEAVVDVEAWTEVRDAIDAMIEFAGEQDRRRAGTRQG